MKKQNVLFSFVALFCWLLSPQIVQATDYYVNPGDDISNIINNVPAGNHTVHIAAGTYQLLNNSRIVVPQGVDIIGAGPDQTFITGTGDFHEDVAMALKANYDNTDTSKLQGFTIYADEFSSSADLQYGIHIEKRHNVHISNVHLKDFYSVAVRVRGEYYNEFGKLLSTIDWIDGFKIHDCYIENSGNTTRNLNASDCWNYYQWGGAIDISCTRGGEIYNNIVNVDNHWNGSCIKSFYGGGYGLGNKIYNNQLLASDHFLDPGECGSRQWPAPAAIEVAGWRETECYNNLITSWTSWVRDYEGMGGDFGIHFHHNRVVYGDSAQAGEAIEPSRDMFIHDNEFLNLYSNVIGSNKQPAQDTDPPTPGPSNIQFYRNIVTLTESLLQAGDRSEKVDAFRVQGRAKYENWKIYNNVFVNYRAILLSLVEREDYGARTGFHFANNVFLNVKSLTHTGYTKWGWGEPAVFENNVMYGWEEPIQTNWTPETYGNPGNMPITLINNIGMDNAPGVDPGLQLSGDIPDPYYKAIDIHSAVVDEGIVISGITDGAVGEPDIGVYEYPTDAPARVAQPSFSSGTGTYNNDVNVTITSTTGATIRYTLDGSQPSATHGTVYSDPVTIGKDGMELRAIAYKSGMANSFITAAEYTLTTAGVTFDPAEGSYDTPQNVSLSTATSGATIRYTLDGINPTTTRGEIYDGTPIYIGGATGDLRAVAYKTDYNSTWTSAAYTITATKAETPAFSVGTGVYAGSQTVEITSATPSATIYYTTNGMFPDLNNGTVYTEPLNISGPTVLRALAYKDGNAHSDLATAHYAIGSAKTYYVSPTGNDNNSGLSASSAWKTLPQAVDRVPGLMGNTIKMATGTYVIDRPLKLPPKVNLEGGSSNEELTRVELNWDGTAWAINGEGDITRSMPEEAPATDGSQTLKNFTLDGIHEKVETGIVFFARDNVTIDNVNVYRFKYTGIKISGWYTNGLEHTMVKGSKIVNCLIYDCASPYGGGNNITGNIEFGGWLDGEIAHCTIVDTLDGGNIGYGIKSFNGGWMQNTSVHDCDITIAEERHSLWGGFFTVELKNPRGNVDIYNMNLNNGVSWIHSIGQAIEQVMPGIPNMVFRDSRIVSKTGLGYQAIEQYINYYEQYNVHVENFGKSIQMHSGTASDNVEHVLIHHCSFKGLANNKGYGIDFGGTGGDYANWEVHNNVWDGFEAVFNAVKGDVTNLDVRNNVVMNSGSVWNATAAVSNVVFDHNVFYNSPQGTSNATFSNNITTNPGLKLSGDKPAPYYEPSGSSSSVVNAGVPLTSDWGGLITANANGTPDIGAYEYNAVTVIPTSVVVTPETLLLIEADEEYINAVVYPSLSANKTVDFITSNSSVATVTKLDNGTAMVTAVGDGTANITATTESGNKTDVCVVTVAGLVPVTGVTIDQTGPIAIDEGQTSTLTATITPSDATNQSVNWISSDPGIASVNSSGMVTGQGAGTAVITSTSVDNPSASDNITFNVTAVAQDPYTGSAFAVPGTINAIQFDLGGEGIAYHENDATVNGTLQAWRTDDATVDGAVTDETDPNSGGSIGWTVDGEWLEYTVDVASAGNYDISLKYGTVNTGAQVHIQTTKDGSTTMLVNNQDVPKNQDDWGDPKTTVEIASDVTLEAGTQIIRLTFKGDAWNLDQLIFAEGSATTNYTLTTSAGTGGSVSPLGSNDYADGSNVQITATANDGYTFTGWSGDLSGSTNPANIVMNADKSVAANFAINTYTLTATAGTGGSVAKSPDQASYNHGATVNVTATANSGYTFSGWTGDVPIGNENDNPISITMDVDKSITASFTENTPGNEITINPVADAYVRGGSYDDTNFGSTTVLYAKDPNDNYPLYTRYAYLKFDLSSISSVTNAKLRIYQSSNNGSETQNASIVNDNSWTESGITYNNRPTSIGSILGSWTTGSNGWKEINITDAVNAAAGVELSIIIEGTNDKYVGYHSKENTNQPELVYIGGTVQHTLTTSAGTGGSVNPSGSNDYDEGLTVDVTATADGGYTFSGWTGDVPSGHENDNPVTITMDADKSITANFIAFSVNDIIVDNNDAGYSETGSWTSSTSNPNYFGTNYRHDGNSGADPSEYATFTPDIQTKGSYKVYLWWTSSTTNRPDAAPVEVNYDGGTDNTVTVDQRYNGGQWNHIGDYHLAAGTSGYVRVHADDDGYTIADAVKFVYDGTYKGAKVFNESITDAAQTFRMYPNPVSENNITLELNGYKENANITVMITDLSGRTVHNSMVMVKGNNHTEELRLNNISKGIYLVSVKASGKVNVEKLVVK